MTRAMSVASILISLLPVYSGCTGGKETPGYAVGMSGDAHRGKDLIKNYGCGACHTIPGIYSARGMVGPPLLSFGRTRRITWSAGFASPKMSRRRQPCPI
jgi:cytochrome c2